MKRKRMARAVLRHLLGDYVLDALVVNFFNLLHLEVDSRLIYLVILYEDEELVIVLNVVAQDIAWMLLLCHAHAPRREPLPCEPSQSDHTFSYRFYLISFCICVFG